MLHCDGSVLASALVVGAKVLVVFVVVVEEVEVVNISSTSIVVPVMSTHFKLNSNEMN